jgi:hypothetical protein
MYASPDETLAALERVGYFTDRKTATTVYLAGKLHRPIMLEGPAGAGKTELATSVSRAYRVPILRLQCYQGINEEKAIGQYDKSLQELYVLLMSKSDRTPDWAKIKREITSRAYYVAGPLLEAIEQEQRCVLLIDEIDKVDYAFEAQAFKRACTCFGLGRYFYNFAEMWVELNDYKQPLRVPSLPAWAMPRSQASENGSSATAVSDRQARSSSGPSKGPLDADVTATIERHRQKLGHLLYQSILSTVAHVRSARDIPNQQTQQNVLQWMESGARGMAQVREIAAEIPEDTFYSILDRHGVQSLAKVQSFGVLKKLVEEMTEVYPRASAA